MTCERCATSSSTLRNYQEAIREQRFGTHPIQVVHEWNTAVHVASVLREWIEDTRPGPGAAGADMAVAAGAGGHLLGQRGALHADPGLADVLSCQSCGQRLDHQPGGHQMLDRGPDAPAHSSQVSSTERGAVDRHDPSGRDGRVSCRRSRPRLRTGPLVMPLDAAGRASEQLAQATEYAFPKHPDAAIRTSVPGRPASGFGTGQRYLRGRGIVAQHGGLAASLTGTPRGDYVQMNITTPMNSVGLCVALACWPW
jgi:hypothetical protein